MSNVVKMKLAIKEQLKNVKEGSTIYQCGRQLAEIVGASECLAQLVLEDFANKRNVKGCEEEIRKHAKANGGGCLDYEAAEIICRYFGLPEPEKRPDPLDIDTEPAPAPTPMSPPKPKVMSLKDLL